MSQNTISEAQNVPSNIQRSRDQAEFSTIIGAMKGDPMGIHYLCKNGVLVSLTADRDVIDAVGLRPGLIKAMVDRFPFDQKIEDRLRGADGTKVPKELWFHLDKSDLPAPLSDELRKEARKMMEEHDRIRKERKEQGIPEPGAQKCPPRVLSDYNLEAES